MDLPNESFLKKRLSEICNFENISVDNDLIYQLITKNNRNLRSCLNDLQFAAYKPGKHVFSAEKRPKLHNEEITDNFALFNYWLKFPHFYSAGTNPNDVPIF